MNDKKLERYTPILGLNIPLKIFGEEQWRNKMNEAKENLFENKDDKDKPSSMEKLTTIINKLVDEDFGNADQRQNFVSMMYKMVREKDPGAKKKIRKLFKYLGDSMSDFKMESTSKLTKYNSLYKE